MFRAFGKTVRGICGVSPGKEKEGYGEKHSQKRKGLSLEWKSEGAMDNVSGESMEPKWVGWKKTWGTDGYSEADEYGNSNISRQMRSGQKKWGVQMVV